MGTRADFYIGRGESAQWVGSIAWDGYPKGIDTAVLTATSESEYIDALMHFFAERDDVSGPDHGWPWPWDTSGLTDYSYAFDNGRVWIANYGYAPWKTVDELHEDECECAECEFSCDCRDDKYQCEHKVRFPDMVNMRNVAWGERSGLIVFRAE